MSNANELRLDIEVLQRDAARLVVSAILEILEDNRPLAHRGLAELAQLRGTDYPPTPGADYADRLRALREKIHGTKEWVVA